MQLLSSLFTAKSKESLPPMGTRLVGKRVMLREPEVGDWRQWSGMRGLSRDFLKPWEPEWPANSLTAGFFDGMLRRQWRDWRRGKAYGFLIFARKSQDITPPPAKTKGLHKQAQVFASSPARGEETLVGGITLNDVRRGIAQKGTLGYWIGMPYTQQGYMTEAAALMCEFAFDALKLNRVEASCLPHNEPSKRLLQRLGFTEEGYAKSYLRIDGEWQDHVLWGKTAGN